jgi:membrane protease subunit (stomatin/prohibitin family)
METALPTSVYRSLQVSGYDNVATTAPPTWYTKLPKDARKEVLKEQSALNSVVTEVLDITQTSTGGAMQQTAPVVAGGAAAAGFLGAVAML